MRSALILRDRTLARQGMLSIAFALLVAVTWAELAWEAMIGWALR